jgi:hypothetical protein
MVRLFRSFTRKEVDVNTPADVTQFKAGDVFQIAEAHGRAGWVGALLMAEDIFPWGVMGFIINVKTHEVQTRTYIRLRWEELYFVGRAALVPGDVLNKGHDDETKEENSGEHSP